MVAYKKCLHISAGIDHGNETSEGDVRKEELVRVKWVQAKETFAHVDEALSNPDNEQLVRVISIVSSQVSEVSS